MDNFDYIITAKCMDLPTSLQRLMSLVRRKGLKVKQLNVTDAEVDGQMLLKLMLEGKHNKVENLVRHLRKMFTMQDVQVSFKILEETKESTIENRRFGLSNRFIDFGGYSPIDSLEEQMATAQIM
ncbi:MAG: acetolactate synthase regulatory subunit [Chlamydiales bacterium]|jgi:acetolactate synthase regulatory subunit